MRPTPSDLALCIRAHRSALTDGGTATCDVLLVLGADGIHSATRRTLLNDAAEEYERASQHFKAEELRRSGKVDPVWSGTVAYRATIPLERILALNPHHNAAKIFQNVSPLNTNPRESRTGSLIYPHSVPRREQAHHRVPNLAWGPPALERGSIHSDKRGTIFGGKTSQECSLSEVNMMAGNPKCNRSCRCDEYFHSQVSQYINWLAIVHGRAATSLGN